MVLKCTTDSIPFEIDDKLIKVKLHNGCQAFRPQIKNKDSLSYDNETIIEKNGKDVSRDKLTKLNLKNNDWISFKIKVSMIGCE